MWSEPLRSEPDQRVIKWMRSVSTESALTTVSLAEMFHGALRLPFGRRQAKLLASLEQLVGQAQDRVLDFDEAAARSYGELRKDRESVGRPISAQDAMIAAICLSRDHPLATRNIQDFQELGLELVNPWEA